MGKDIRAPGESATTQAHTPGPWAVRADREFFNVNAADGSLVIGEEGFYRMDGEDEANARLVAAAPDLLEALREVLDAIGAIDQPWNLEGHGIPARRAEEICGLLDKAEGK